VKYFNRLEEKGLVEIAQHGFRHCSNEYHDMANNGLSEFSDLSFTTQHSMISKGKRYLEQVLNKHVNIFCPPYNSYDKNTVKALKTLDFSVLSGGDRTYPYSNLYIIDRTAGFKELRYYLNKPVEKIPPYIFVMYHSYEITTKNDYKMLDSILYKAKEISRIRFSKLVPFAKKYGNTIYEIEKLNNKVRMSVKKVWFSVYFENHLLEIFNLGFGEDVFKKLDYALILDSRRLITRLAV